MNVDRLAQIIRKVDGSNNLGAGALAEAVLRELWQPIETAPNGEEIMVGVWVDCDVNRRWSCWVAWDEFNSGKFGNDGEFGDKPTHWMPLPSPPEQNGDET